MNVKDHPVPRVPRFVPVEPITLLCVLCRAPGSQWPVCEGCRGNAELGAALYAALEEATTPDGWTMLHINSTPHVRGKWIINAPAASLCRTGEHENLTLALHQTIGDLRALKALIAADDERAALQKAQARDGGE